MRQWRLIDDYPASGAYNMAVDMAILESVARGDALPTLRFYGWNPPCLSLGYGQRAADVDFTRVAQMGWEVVRRPTGGRAILHIDELTYSLALPASDSIAAGSVVDSYRRISTALVAGLRKIGLQPEADSHTEPISSGGPVCFETPSHYEITVGGRKLIGSAQVRRGGGVLQHGSLPLFGDLARICDALAYPDDSAREAARALVRARAITLWDALSQHFIPPRYGVERGLGGEDFPPIFARAFSETFNITLEPSPLTAGETRRAQDLMHQIYGSESWTRRR